MREIWALPSVRVFRFIACFEIGDGFAPIATGLTFAFHRAVDITARAVRVGFEAHAAFVRGSCFGSAMLVIGANEAAEVAAAEEIVESVGGRFARDVAFAFHGAGGAFAREEESGRGVIVEDAFAAGGGMRAQVVVARADVPAGGA